MKSKNIIGFSAGPILTATLGFVIVPVTTWIFSPADVGRLNILQITMSLVVLISVLGLDQAYVREYHESTDREQLLLACFMPGFLVLLTLALGSCFFARPLANLLYADPNPWLYLVTLMACIAGYLSRFLSLILRMQERGWAYSISQILPKIIQVILIISVATATSKKEFIHLQLITLTSTVLVLLVYAWNTRNEWQGALSKQIEKRQLNQLLTFGTPLIFSGLAYWGLSATSTLVLRTRSSLDELAVYSVANSFAGAAIIFQSIFSAIWAPTVYKWVSDGADMQIVSQIAQQVLTVMCAIISFCGSFSWLCDLMLPGKYMQVKYIMVCMLIQPLIYVLSEVTCIGIGIQRRTVLTIWITLVALITNVGLSLLLVPSHGAAGAAIANALAFSVLFLARTEVSARIWRTFPRGRLYIFVFGIVGFSILTIFNDPRKHLFIHFSWAAMLFLTVYIFRKEWRQIKAILSNASFNR